MRSDLVAAEVTGVRPLQSYGSYFGGRDDFDSRALVLLWDGCLDAPNLMPAGSVIPVNIPTDIGGMGYEGNVSRIIERA